MTGRFVWTTGADGVDVVELRDQAWSKVLSGELSLPGWVEFVRILDDVSDGAASL